jgi:hypothetical protein
MLSALKFVSSSTKRLYCFALSWGLILSMLPLAPSLNIFSAGAAVQRTQGPPSKNLPNLEEAKRINPGPSKAADPVPPTKCRRRDENCKREKGETSQLHEPSVGQASDRLFAFAKPEGPPKQANRYSILHQRWYEEFIFSTSNAKTDSAAPDTPVAWSFTEPASLTNLAIQTQNDIAMAMTDPNNRTGEPGEDLLSRNFNWTLPLISVPGRAGLDLGFGISYNSLIWTKVGSTIQFDLDWGNPTPGFEMGFPTIQRAYTNTQAGTNAYLLIMPTGKRVEFRQTAANVFEAFDSTYLHLTYDPSLFIFILRSTDGT